MSEDECYAMLNEMKKRLCSACHSVPDYSGFTECEECSAFVCKDVCSRHAACCEVDICDDCIGERSLLHCKSCNKMFHEEGCTGWSLVDTGDCLRCSKCNDVIACARCLAAHTSTEFLTCVGARKWDISSHLVLCSDCAEEWDQDFEALRDAFEAEWYLACDCEPDKSEGAEHMTTDCFKHLRWGSKVTSLAAGLCRREAKSKSAPKVGKGKGKKERKEGDAAAGDFFSDDAFALQALLPRVFNALQRRSSY